MPDLTGSGLPDGTCVPNAQHALRQAKRLAKNLWASRWDKPLKDYKHKNLGAVAGFGAVEGRCQHQSGCIGLKGPLAWLAHRGYHGLAMPTFERKLRVISGWFISLFAGRDTTMLLDLDQPRSAFRAAASPAPKPAAAPVPAAPAVAAAAPAATAAPVAKAEAAAPVAKAEAKSPEAAAEPAKASKAKAPAAPATAPKGGGSAPKTPKSSSNGSSNGTAKQKAKAPVDAK